MTDLPLSTSLPDLEHLWRFSDRCNSDEIVEIEQPTGGYSQVKALLQTASSRSRSRQYISSAQCIFCRNAEFRTSIWTHVWIHSNHLHHMRLQTWHRDDIGNMPIYYAWIFLVAWMYRRICQRNGEFPACWCRPTAPCRWHFHALPKAWGTACRDLQLGAMAGLGMRTSVRFFR